MSSLPLIILKSQFSRSKHYCPIEHMTENIIDTDINNNAILVPYHVFNHMFNPTVKFTLIELRFEGISLKWDEI